MVERLNLSVDEGISAMLTELAGGERKRGQWLSDLVRSMYEQRQQIASSDVEQLKMGFAGVVGSTKMLEARVTQLERDYARLVKALDEQGQ